MLSQKDLPDTRKYSAPDTRQVLLVGLLVFQDLSGSAMNYVIAVPNSPKREVSYLIAVGAKKESPYLESKS